MQVTVRILGFLFFLFATSQTMAAMDAFPPLPSSRIFPDQEGIVFPGLHVAAGVNAARLGNFKKGNSVQLAVSPATDNSSHHQYLISSTFTRKQFGLGLGLTGDYQSDNNTFGLFSGLGFNLEPVSLGIGIRDAYLSDSFSPEVDFSLTLGDPRNGLNFGLVLYQIETSARAHLGLGYSAGRKYNLEAGILIPQLSALNSSGSPYRLSVSARVFIDFLQFYFRTAYTTVRREFSHTLGFAFALGEHFNALIQFNTPRSWTAGITFHF